MCCITMVLNEATMATTRLMRATSYELRWTRPEAARVEFQPPRMNWVVVTDNNKRRMLMRWAPSAEDR